MWLRRGFGGGCEGTHSQRHLEECRLKMASRPENRLGRGGGGGKRGKRGRRERQKKTKGQREQREEPREQAAKPAELQR